MYIMKAQITSLLKISLTALCITLADKRLLSHLTSHHPPIPHMTTKVIVMLTLTLLLMCNSLHYMLHVMHIMYIEQKMVVNHKLVNIEFNKDSNTFKAIELLHPDYKKSSFLNPTRIGRVQTLTINGDHDIITVRHHFFFF